MKGAKKQTKKKVFPKASQNKQILQFCNSMNILPPQQPSHSFRKVSCLRFSELKQVSCLYLFPFSTTLLGALNSATHIAIK